MWVFEYFDLYKHVLVYCSVQYCKEVSNFLKMILKTLPKT